MFPVDEFGSPTEAIQGISWPKSTLFIAIEIQFIADITEVVYLLRCSIRLSHQARDVPCINWAQHKKANETEMIHVVHEEHLADHLWVVERGVYIA